MLGKFRGNILLKFVLSVVSSRCLYVHACFFLYLPFSLSFVSPHTLLSHCLFLSYSHTYACTLVSFLVLTMAYNTRARASQRTRLHTIHTYTKSICLLLITHSSARTRTHHTTHTYSPFHSFSFASCLFFLSLDCRSVNVSYRVYDS